MASLIAEHSNFMNCIKPKRVEMLDKRCENIHPENKQSTCGLVSLNLTLRFRLRLIPSR